MKNLAIVDDSFKEVFQRDMRVYLVKTEEEFTRLALEKYQEEIKLNVKSSKVAKSNQSSASANQRGNTGKTQACSDKSMQSGQKLKHGSSYPQRQNKTANESVNENLK